MYLLANRVTQDSEAVTSPIRQEGTRVPPPGSTFLQRDYSWGSCWHSGEAVRHCYCDRQKCHQKKAGHNTRTDEKHGAKRQTPTVTDETKKKEESSCTLLLIEETRNTGNWLKNRFKANLVFARVSFPKVLRRSAPSRSPRFLPNVYLQ